MILKSRLGHLHTTLCAFALALVTLTAFEFVFSQVFVENLFLTILMPARDSELVEQFYNVPVDPCKSRFFLGTFWADICGEKCS